ncbi:MAG: hypothetical protein ACJZ4J_01945 [Candidatus Poseidoniales archaeon]
MNRSDEEATIESDDKALNTRQKGSISLILFSLFIFLLIPIHSVEIADYSGNTFQEVRDEMVCGVERCQMKVSIVDLWTCDYEGQKHGCFLHFRCQKFRCNYWDTFNLDIAIIVGVLPQIFLRS